MQLLLTPPLSLRLSTPPCCMQLTIIARACQLAEVPKELSLNASYGTNGAVSPRPVLCCQMHAARQRSERMHVPEVERAVQGLVWELEFHAMCDSIAAHQVLVLLCSSCLCTLLADH